MNIELKKNFVYLTENTADTTLESFALNSISRNRKIIYIDTLHSSEDSVNAFKLVNSRTFRKASYLENPNSSEIISSAQHFDIVYARLYIESRTQICETIEQIAKDESISDTMILMNLKVFDGVKNPLEPIVESILKHNNQFYIQTEDEDLFLRAKALKDVICYKFAENIDFL